MHSEPLEKSVLDLIRPINEETTDAYMSYIESVADEKDHVPVFGKTPKDLILNIDSFLHAVPQRYAIACVGFQQSGGPRGYLTGEDFEGHYNSEYPAYQGNFFAEMIRLHS